MTFRMKLDLRTAMKTDTVHDLLRLNFVNPEMVPQLAKYLLSECKNDYTFIIPQSNRIELQRTLNNKVTHVITWNNKDFFGSPITEYRAHIKVVSPVLHEEIPATIEQLRKHPVFCRFDTYFKFNRSNYIVYTHLDQTVTMGTYRCVSVIGADVIPEIYSDPDNYEYQHVLALNWERDTVRLMYPEYKKPSKHEGVPSLLTDLRAAEPSSAELNFEELDLIAEMLR